MKFKLKQNVLVEYLQKGAGPSTLKQNFPILNSILIEAFENKVTLTSTDLDVTIITTLSSEVTTQGVIAVPVKSFSSVIRELPSQEISFEIIKNILSIKCDQIEFKLNILNAKEFPKIDLAKEVSLIKLDPDDLSQILKMTCFCVGYEDTNYVLNGVYFEIFESTITAAATDGKRLSVCQKRLPQTQSELKSKISFILPIKGIHEIQKLLKEHNEEIFLFIDKNKIGIELNTSKILLRPIEGEFPQYKQFIPKESNYYLTIRRDLFLNSLKRAAILSTVDFQSVKLDIKKDSLFISKSTPQLGEIKEVLSCSYSGKPLTIGFNPHYLIDVLRNLDDESVRIEFSDATKPAVLRQEDYTYLVLPIKI